MRTYVKDFWVCGNCDGRQTRECVGYVNGTGWCRGCLRRRAHWWAWLIPVPPTNPLAFLLWSYAIAPVLAFVFVLAITHNSTG